MKLSDVNYTSKYLVVIGERKDFGPYIEFKKALDGTRLYIELGFIYIVIGRHPWS